MTQMEHSLCLLWGCLIGHFIVYGWCRFWDFIGRKRVEIPEIKYDVADNPILTLKNRLGQAYVASYDRTAKKLLHRLLEYVEWIDNWHKEQVLIVESKRNGYKRMYELSREKLETERSKNAELTKQLKDAELKNEQLRQMLKLNIGEPLITPQEWRNIYDKKPIPVGYSGTAMTATEATELAEHLMNMTSQPIVLDSETLNETQIKNEEFIKQLRDWWGLEASKAIEIAMPDADKKDEPPIYSEEFNKKLREIWFGVDNDTECHQYSVTVRKYGDCTEKKIVVLARSPIEAAKLVPKGYTVEGMSRLFE